VSRRSPLAALLLAATLLAPRPAQAQTDRTGEPIIVELSVGRYGVRTVEALRLGREVLLPLSVVADLAELRYQRVPPASVELVLEPGARRAVSDPTTTRIRFGDTTLALTPADRIVRDGEHYLSTRILGALLHTTFAVNWADLSVAVLDADSLPVGRRRARERALAALRRGREGGIPTLGTCGGCQHMLLEFGRNVLGVEDAQHAEYDPYASRLFVTPLTCEVAGRTMHVTLDPSSRLYGGATEVQEQYYCNFGLNPEYRDQLDPAGFRITGVDADGDARVFELDDHPFYVATLFVPQMRSEPGRPHPVVSGFVGAAAASMVA